MMKLRVKVDEPNLYTYVLCGHGMHPGGPSKSHG